jgi:hypothetical protein
LRLCSLSDTGENRLGRRRRARGHAATQDQGQRNECAAGPTYTV